METSQKALKKFVGEKAYNIIQNEEVNLDKLRAALVTPTNARNVFSELHEADIRNIIANICNRDALIKIAEVSQQDIISAFAKCGYDTVIFDDYDKIEECKKYYASGEKICTYNNLRSRMHEYHMLVVVKRDIANIKRAKSPKRDDEYGTSILNIQIAKNGAHYSIKNRYNHTVAECDATLNNNLDNLLYGLQNMVLNYYNFAAQAFDKQHYNSIVIINGVYLKYKIEMNNVYYGDFVLSVAKGIQFVDKERFNIKIRDNGYYSAPFLIDFHKKNAMIFESETYLSIAAVYTHLLQKNILHSGNRNNNLKGSYNLHRNDLKAILPTAMPFLHDCFKFNWEKPYNVKLVLGSFTLNSLNKIMGTTKYLVFTCYENEFCMASVNNSSFEIDGGHAAPWHKHRFSPDTFYNKGSFHEARKNSESIAIVIAQEDEYHFVPKPSVPNKITPSLEERLKVYKTQKARIQSNNFDYAPWVIELETLAESFRNALLERISHADYKQLGWLIQSSSYSTERALQAIPKFHEDCMNHNFTSIQNGEDRYSSLKDKLLKAIEKLQ